MDLKKTHPKTFKLFYYKLVIAFCDNHFDECKSWLNLMKETAKKNDEIIEKSLSYHQIDHLKSISFAVKNGYYNVDRSDPNESEKHIAIQCNRKKCLESEKELERKLALCYIGRIAGLIGTPEAKLYAVQHPIENDGSRCDLVLRSNDTIVAVELKKDLANHQVVAQMDKYLKSLTKSLIYELWQHVKGVVVANGYTQYALQELKAMGVHTLKYEARSDGSIELIRI